ncbi:MAG: endolytic transglycosylase MltG [Lachnospiraceae bacterium]|nr:endolytic transglycosylase MltG [Lachnospiraceae bacterium]
MSASKVVMRIVRICLSTLLVVLIIYVLIRSGVYAYDMGYRLFTEEPVSSEENGQNVALQITEDMSARDIGKILEERNLVRDGNLFAMQLTLSAYKDKLVPGVYTLNSSMTAEEMMQVMSQTEEEKE